jgi:hypothetical protein
VDSPATTATSAASLARFESTSVLQHGGTVRRANHGQPVVVHAHEVAGAYGDAAELDRQLQLAEKEFGCGPRRGPGRWGSAWRNVRTIANRAVNADPGDAPQRRGAHHQAAREGDVRLAAGVDDDHRTCRCPCDREMDSESPG